jgi:hypothetical protein
MERSNYRAQLKYLPVISKPVQWFKDAARDASPLDAIDPSLGSSLKSWISSSLKLCGFPSFMQCPE